MSAPHENRSHGALTIREAAARYESVDASRVNDWLREFLPSKPAAVLDVGAGSGRDAAWLASLGHDVVAVEPERVMREEVLRWHPQSRFELIADRLPELAKIFRSGLSFDFILVNAVWTFIAPTRRKRAFRKLVTLLEPQGVIALTLREGPTDTGRGMHPVSVQEIEQLARRHGAYVERVSEDADFLGRPGLTWKRIAIRLPDDGTGALPLIRRVVLNDNKSSTYKLALLRILCRIASGTPGFVRETSGDHVEIPLGAAALYWIRLYLPLLMQDLPQSPANRYGFIRLRFANDALEKLRGTPAYDLRIGMHVGDDLKNAVHRALLAACETIARMPAKHITYADGRPILPVVRKQTRLPDTLQLNGAYLSSFGNLYVPTHLWRAVQRYTVWVEPALVEEWIGLTLDYAERQGRRDELDELMLRKTMQWSEPKRERETVRKRALELLDRNPVYCVWTGRRLRTRTLDIDHCFPWSAWPCDDLWNLLPTQHTVNRHEKRNCLPDDPTLRGASELIMRWWKSAYLSESVLDERFRLEALARLPTLDQSDFDLADVFDAMSLQRLRLARDQRIPEWSGVGD